MDSAKTVLVVAPEPASLRRLLGALPEFTPVGAAGPTEALALLAERRFDLVLCEYQLPEATGLDLLRECKAQHPSMRRLLVASYADVLAALREALPALSQEETDDVFAKTAIRTYGLKLSRASDAASSTHEP